MQACGAEGPQAEEEELNWNWEQASELVAFLQQQKITHIRLYDADPNILGALSDTNIRVIISVPNNQLLAIGSSNSTASSWIRRNVVAYYPRTLITGISVGDEVLTTVPSSAPLLLPALQSLHAALVASKLHNEIKEMVDPNTLLHYTNVLDAMIDSAYFSMKNLNVTDVVVLVTETGWPSKGDSKEPYATRENADTYNSNLIKHVFDRSGTPLHPEITSSVYIYELFNEDLRSSPVSEANWGLFYGNVTPVYLLRVSGVGTFLANDTANQTYCIAMDGVDSKTLQAALDWACGPGRANCSEIQPGENCYQPKNNQGKSPGSCDFKGAAMITTTDPSHGNCIFPGR
ncbi:X8 domain [Sesbania bispinosa]|nr:X8 domain [Sesbania bispinosa]